VTPTVFLFSLVLAFSLGLIAGVIFGGLLVGQKCMPEVTYPDEGE
jgi:hypothetical protein